MKDKLTVEIFRDKAFSDIDSVEGVQGIERVKNVLPHLEIVRDNRSITISDDDTNYINYSRVRWPKFDADINVVLTGRSFRSETSDGEIAGMAASMGRQPGVAVVKRTDRILPSMTAITVAHEVGHLLNLSYERNNAAERHCESQECIMWPYVSMVFKEELVAQKGIRLWLEKQGRRKSVWNKTRVPEQQNFCNDCTDQMNEKAFWQLRARQGAQVLDSFL